jgi:hypothetical protein
MDWSKPPDQEMSLMKHYRIETICAVSILAVGLAMMCHELAHVLTGQIAGGSPTLMTATEVQGNFEALSSTGLVALGISGFVINTLFCILGWWILNHKNATAELHLCAWYFFSINGMILTTAMISETMAGFGDWMTILDQLPATTLLRMLVGFAGLVGLILFVRLSGYQLAGILPNGSPSQRFTEARRIVLFGALASTFLVLGGSVANPIGTLRSVLLALGAGLVPFIPLIFSTRFVPKVSADTRTSWSAKRWPWILASIAVTSLMWLFVGPGITF